MAECVVASRFNGVENRNAAAAEHFEIEAELAIDTAGKWKTFIEEDARFCDQMLHQRDVVVAEPARNNVVFAYTVLRGDIQRNIDAAFFKVARNVLPKVGELQRGASCIGQFLALFIAIPTEIEHQAANGIRRIDTVVENGLPGGIALDDLIVPKCLQEISKGLPGNIFCRDCFAKRDKHSVRWMALVAGVQFLLPPIEQFQRPLRVRDFIAKIIGPATIRVQIVEVLV